MKYWLFQVMYEWSPHSWEVMVKAGIAAQNYPKGLFLEKINIEDLGKLRSGHRVVAALGRHRFAGYGTLKSRLRRDKRGILMRTADGSVPFKELLRCDWTAIPREAKKKWVGGGDLKARGFLVDLQRGRCVARTDAQTFREVKARIDKQRKLASQREDLDSLRAEEGKKKGRYVNYYERKPQLRIAAIDFHGEDCIVCGFNFGKRYGERGEGFIEVHHLKPIAPRGRATPTDSKKHMAVVCANCHRMLHRRKDDIWSPRKLRAQLRRKRVAQSR